MKHRIFFALMVAVIATLGLNAQMRNRIGYQLIHTDFQERLQEQRKVDAAACLDKRKVLAAKEYLLDELPQLWTDGRNILITSYDRATRQIEVSWDLRDNTDTTGLMAPHFLKVVGTKITTKSRPTLKITVEQLGRYTMLVYRNTAGNPVHAFYKISRDEFYSDQWALMVFNLLDGLYKTEKDEDVVFGAKLPFYTTERYEKDPGIYCFWFEPNKPVLTIAYAWERASRGDPSSDRYDKMPGGGGAGALKGPMQWSTAFTTAGLDVVVTLDEPFVDHNPALDNDRVNQLTKVKCPWEGIDGKWAFASVMPLSRQLLRMFPSEVLTLMRGEIYARHGDSFASSDTQKYFDAQPWYKKSKKPVVLSDIERFNSALIKQVEAEK